MIYSLECKWKLHHSDPKYYSGVQQPRLHVFSYFSSLVWITPHMIQSENSQSTLSLRTSQICSYFSGIGILLPVGTFSLCHLMVFSCNELLHVCCQLQWPRLENAINQFLTEWHWRVLSPVTKQHLFLSTAGSRVWWWNHLKLLHVDLPAAVASISVCVSGKQVKCRNTEKSLHVFVATASVQITFPLFPGWVVWLPFQICSLLFSVTVYTLRCWGLWILYTCCFAFLPSGWVWVIGGRLWIWEKRKVTVIIPLHPHSGMWL